MRRTVLASAIFAVLQMGFSTFVAGQAPAPKKADEPAEMAPQQIESIVVKGSFLGAGAQSAMKLDIPIRDTPFSVESYTSSFMKAIETSAVSDLYNYMNGVKKAGNTAYDLTMRGFKTNGDDKNAIMVDGLPGLTGRFGSPPTIGVERIEVVKGPMSLLYGQVQPGGFVNIITKKPRSQRVNSIDLKGSTFAGHGIGFGDRYGGNIAADSTGPLDADRQFLYRVVGEVTDRDGFRHETYERGAYIAPSVTWNISDTTYLTALYEHRDVETSFDVGLAAPNRDISLVAPITTRYQEPDDWRKEKGDTLSLSASHTLNDDWTLNAGLRSAKNASDDSTYTSVSVRPNGVDLVRRARQNHIERTYNFGDLNLAGEFATGPLKHKIIVGANGGRDIADENRLKFFNSGACPGAQCFDINLYNPVYGRVPDINSLPAFNPATPNLLTNGYFVSTAWGAYTSDLITLTEHWKVSIGGRHVNEKQIISDKRQTSVPTTTKVSTKGLLPTGGILFQPNKEWTIYASYAESYVPAPANSQTAEGTNPFQPAEGKLNEVGTKFEGLFDGKLNGAAALYRIDRKNTLNNFACPRGTCQSQIGNEQSKGFELEFNARPLEDWQLVFNYAYTDAKIKSAIDPIQVNARLTNVPKNSASIWSRYDIPKGMLKGLGVGVGVVYTGERTGTLPTTATTATAGPTVLVLPAYTVVDLAFNYIYERYAFNLKVGNLFDKTYYESAGFTGVIQIAPGAPRTVTLSMRVNF